MLHVRANQLQGAQQSQHRCVSGLSGDTTEGWGKVGFASNHSSRGSLCQGPGEVTGVSTSSGFCRKRFRSRGKQPVWCAQRRGGGEGGAQRKERSRRRCRHMAGGMGGERRRLTTASSPKKSYCRSLRTDDAGQMQDRTGRVSPTASYSMQTWTILQYDGPDNLGFWSNAAEQALKGLHNAMSQITLLWC